MGDFCGRSALVGTCLALSLFAPRAHAQTAGERAASEFRLRAAASTGVMASDDQRSFLILDLPLAEAEVRAGWVAHEFVVLEARLGGGAFFSSARAVGGLLDLALGAEVGGDIGPGRLWGSAHAGVGLTGSLVRPILRIALGIDVEVSEEIAIGPVIAYGHLFQEDGPTFSDDAQFFTLGLSFTHQALLGPPEPESEPEPQAPPPPPPPLPLQLPEPEFPEPASPAALMEMLDEAAGLQPRELLVPVLFHFDSTNLVACSVSSLHSLREHLAEHPEIEVLEIEGHADGSGSDEYNAELSLRRAERIRDWLVEHGVAPERLVVRGRGEAAPVESNEGEPGREQNRRARFRVVQER